MSSPAPPSQPIRQVLDRSEPLMRLTERLALSNRRWQCVAQKLPAAMQAAIQPGPIDDAGWTLLAGNGAVAAKLRHMVPVLEAQLAANGWPPLTLRIKVLAGS